MSLTLSGATCPAISFILAAAQGLLLSNPGIIFCARSFSEFGSL